MLRNETKELAASACLHNQGLTFLKWVVIISTHARVMKIVLPEKAEEVVEFRADPELQARIEELARKSTEGELSDPNAPSMQAMRGGISSLRFLSGKPAPSSSRGHKQLERPGRYRSRY